MNVEYFIVKNLTLMSDSLIPGAAAAAGAAEEAALDPTVAALFRTLGVA